MQLPPEIEHIYPDYSIYPELTKETAYGFMSRGCPRGCGFATLRQKREKGHTRSLTCQSFGEVKETCLIRPEPDCVSGMAGYIAAAN